MIYTKQITQNISPIIDIFSFNLVFNKSFFNDENFP
jgi:hypothetical protein